MMSSTTAPVVLFCRNVTFPPLRMVMSVSTILNELGLKGRVHGGDESTTLSGYVTVTFTLSE